MLDEVNDEEEHAHQLGKLLETFEVVSSIFYINACRKSDTFSFAMKYDAVQILNIWITDLLCTLFEYVRSNWLFVWPCC